MTAARVATVQNVLTHPGTSSPIVGRTVSIRLNVPAFANTGGSTEKVQTGYATTDATGLWSKTLEINDDLDPAGTSYTVREASGVVWTFILTAANASQTVNLRAVLVDDPGNPDPMTAGVPLPGVSVPAGDVFVTDGAGSGTYQPQSGGSGAVDSVFTRTGDVVAASGDYAAFYDALGAAATAQAAAIAALQPLDPDLTTIAGLDSTQSGVVASDGAGWFRKTYAAIKTALGLTKSDVGLGNVDNTSDANKPVSTAQQTALNLKANLASPALTGTPTAPDPTTAQGIATQNYVLNAVVGLQDYRGPFDASGNVFPSTGGSGLAGAVAKADFWRCSVQGTLGGTVVRPGDLIIALVDAPGQTAGNWDLVEHDLGYAPEDAANKSIDGTLGANSDTLYPSQKAARTYADAVQTAAQSYADGKVIDSIADADTTHAPSRNAVFDALALKAPLTSPAFLLNPTALTQAPGDNSTKLSTTGYVDTACGLLVPKSLFTTKGDLAVATASATLARLGVGSDGQVLTADSAQSAGVKWAAAAAGVDGVIDPAGTSGYGYQIPGMAYGVNNVTATYTANTLFFCPFTLQTQRTLTELAISVVTAGSAGSLIRLGVYSANSSFSPSGLVLDAGTVAADSTGMKRITGLTQVLNPGRYLFAWMNNSTGPISQLVAVSPSGPYTGVKSGLTTGPIQYAVAQTFGAMPASPVPVPGGSNANFLLASVFGLFT